jgi:anthranilate phosphoribosyltransferase
MALARRGETVEEIGCFARELRQRSVVPVISAELRAGDLLDVVGTGGDRLNTFNISTASALLVSALGVRVAKHGNRAVTSKSGSADVLEALGIRVDLEAGEVGGWLEEHGFAFLFAPKFHPAFRHIAPARKLCAAAGQRTLFNYLGPLLNPARPSLQLMGVPEPGLCEPMARVLRSLGVRRGMVVCGEVSVSAGGSVPGGAFVDEFSVLGPTTIAEFYQDRALAVSVMEVGRLPVSAGVLGDLVGADAARNAAMVRGVLEGVDRGVRRESVLLNAGAGLWLAGVVRSVEEGWWRAASGIDDGRAAEKLAELVAASRRD